MSERGAVGTPGRGELGTLGRSYLASGSGPAWGRCWRGGRSAQSHPSAQTLLWRVGLRRRGRRVRWRGGCGGSRRGEESWRRVCLSVGTQWGIRWSLQNMVSQLAQPKCWSRVRKIQILFILWVVSATQTLIEAIYHHLHSETLLQSRFLTINDWWHIKFNSYFFAQNIFSGFQKWPQRDYTKLSKKLV